MPSLCVTECVCCVFIGLYKKEPSLCPSGHNTPLTRGPENQQGEGHKRMRAERDRWMEEAEREDCEGGTDGAQKGDSSEEGNGGPRKEGNRVNSEERYSGDGGGGGKEEER